MEAMELQLSPPVAEEFNELKENQDDPPFLYSPKKGPSQHYAPSFSEYRGSSRYQHLDGKEVLLDSGFADSLEILPPPPEGHSSAIRVLMFCIRECHNMAQKMLNMKDKKPIGLSMIVLKLRLGLLWKLSFGTDAWAEENQLISRCLMKINGIILEIGLETRYSKNISPSSSRCLELLKEISREVDFLSCLLPSVVHPPCLWWALATSLLTTSDHSDGINIYSTREMTDILRKIMGSEFCIYLISMVHLHNINLGIAGPMSFKDGIIRLDELVFLPPSASRGHHDYRLCRDICSERGGLLFVDQILGAIDESATDSEITPSDFFTALQKRLQLHKPQEFRVLPLAGYIENYVDKSIDLLFRIPAWVVPWEPPSSLERLLQKRWLPSEYNRVFLALQLASAVLHFHATGWIHGNLSCSTVLFFKQIDAQELSQAAPNYAGFNLLEPFLCTFRKSYLENAINRRATEVYNLGLILLQIALWEPKAVTLKSQNLAKDIEASLPRMNRRLGRRGVDVFTKVVKSCLSGEAAREGLIGEKLELESKTGFYWKVLQPLEDYMAILEGEGDNMCARDDKIKTRERSLIQPPLEKGLYARRMALRDVSKDMERSKTTPEELQLQNDSAQPQPDGSRDNPKSLIHEGAGNSQKHASNETKDTVIPKMVKFEDAVGRKFSLPFESCRKWSDMHSLVTQVFLQVDIIGPHVIEGHYDLQDSDGNVIVPQVWDSLVKPDWNITMRMWPLPGTMQLRPPTSSEKTLTRPLLASIERFAVQNGRDWYVLNVTFVDGTHWSLARYYQNFYDLHIALLEELTKQAGRSGQNRFLPRLPGKVQYVTYTIAAQRKSSLDEYIQRLMGSTIYMSCNKLIDCFFTPLAGDRLDHSRPQLKLSGVQLPTPEALAHEVPTDLEDTPSLSWTEVEKVRQTQKRKGKKEKEKAFKFVRFLDAVEVIPTHYIFLDDVDEDEKKNLSQLSTRVITYKMDLGNCAISSDMSPRISPTLSPAKTAQCDFNQNLSVHRKKSQDLHPTHTSPGPCSLEIALGDMPLGPEQSLKSEGDRRIELQQAKQSNSYPNAIHEPYCVRPTVEVPSESMCQTKALTESDTSSKVKINEKGIQKTNLTKEGKKNMYAVYTSDSTLKKWEEILPRLEKLLARLLPLTEPVTIDLLGIGVSREKSRPTIVVTCESIARVKSFLRKKFTYDDAIFDLKIRKGCIRRSSGRRRRKAIRRSTGAGFEPSPNRAYQPKPLSGASIGACLNGQSFPPGTYGGLILLDGHPYGMTVHHLLDPPSDEEQGESDFEEGSEYDDYSSEGSRSDYSSSNTEVELLPLEWIDSEESDNEDGEYDSDFDEFSETEETTQVRGADGYSGDIHDETAIDFYKDFGDIPGLEKDHGKDIVITQPAEGDLDPESPSYQEHLKRKKLGTILASSGIRRVRIGSDKHEIDWALVEIEKDRLGQRNVIRGGGRYLCSKQDKASTDLEPCSIVTMSELGELKVHATGRTSGLQGGIISRAMSSVKLHGRQTFSKSWHVVGNLGVPGDSGSWVVDNLQGRVCGHVLARCSIQKVSYIVPMELMLQDIKSTLNAHTVELPTPPANSLSSEVEKLILNEVVPNVPSTGPINIDKNAHSGISTMSTCEVISFSSC